MDVDFDRVAAAWERWSAVREAGARPVSERLVTVARIGPGATVLDIGTGLGEPSLTAALAAGPDGRVVGVDISAAMVESARRRAQRECVGNVQFLVSDGLSKAPAGPYDAVVSRWGMMFFEDLDAVLAGVFALLRPGGSFATATWGKPHEVPLISLPMTLGAGPGGTSPNLARSPFALHDTDDLARRLRAAGFTDVVSEPFEVVYTLDSPSQYYEHVSEMTPPVAAILRDLDEAARAAFRSAVEWRVGEKFGMPDGTVRVPNRALITSAVRPA
jgi:ubiquinone/menaquinone biosynthesis C-methylase UbiE